MDTLLADWSMWQSSYIGPTPPVYYNPNHWVVDLDFNAVAAAGIGGVIIRTGVGLLEDPCFVRYLAGLQRVGLPWGVYHAYHPDWSVQGQIDRVRASCPQTPPLGVFADVEIGAATFAGVNAFMNGLDAAYGRVIGLYSANWYLGATFSLSEQSHWRGRPAWFAGYPNLDVPAGWLNHPRQFDMHQFTNEGTLAGVPRRTDLSRLHPTLTLNDLLNGLPASTPTRGRGRGRGRGSRRPVTPPAPPPVSTPAPAGRARFGLHGRADGRLQPPDLQVVRDARMEAVKLMSTADPADVDRLLAIDGQMHLVVRCFADFRNRVITAQQFAHDMAGDLAPFMGKVQHFEIHNEPNLVDEGLRLPGTVGTWANGREFGDWFLAVKTQLSQQFPNARWGWPGLSPGGDSTGQRADSARFLAEAGDAPRQADWIGLHAYWQNEAEMETALADIARAAAAFPGQKLYITEFANVKRDEDPAVRAADYIKFCARLRRLPVEAAFAFVSSASNPDFAFECWRDEQGQLSVIPGLVGARQPPAPPARAADRWWEQWPAGVLAPPRRLISPPAPIQMFQKTGAPLSPPVFRQNAMDVFERNGDLLRVLQTAINGRLWWVRAADVQPE